MQQFVFGGGHIVLPDRVAEDISIVIGDGRIEAILPHPPSPALPRVDLEGRWLVPGFVDLHVHGGGGADFMDGDVEAVLTACHAHLRHGTTTIFPTTTTGSPHRITAMLDACRKAIEQQQQNVLLGARMEGIHLYGPYFAPDKVGCHSTEGCRPPEAKEYLAYLASGMVKIATCAAELPGATEFYRQAAQAGCLVTCGHSNASWSEMELAYRAGLRHVDHFWCAMSSVASLRQRFGTPMQASMAEFVLATAEMSTEVIADGCHLAPELLRFAYQLIGPQRLCLVTDCNRALDQPPGQYRFGHFEDGTLLYSDGQVGWTSDRKSLASSVRGLDWMVRHMVSVVGIPLHDAVRMASLTPAQRSGIDHHVGSISIGKRADLVVLNKELQVEQVFLGGQLVFDSLQDRDYA
ncbi:MAG: N-acetylglucosamine-6-phosphate deacetylase [Pirellulaceae bacterium]|nr:MAG: N-acetylglucosamine-6-phosphate deacetylase [Pirellulaceae bacterium]